MNNTIITILKKELARFFGDKRTAFSTILLPGLMIFIMYNFMGDALNSQFSVEEDYKYECLVQNLPADEMLQSMLKPSFTLKEISSDTELKNAKESLTKKKGDLCVVFPKDFAKAIQKDYTIQMDVAAPEVQVFYNSSETTSDSAYTTMLAILDEYEGILSNRFDINRNKDSVTFDLAKEEDSAGSIFASMLPMLLLIFLYSGTIAIAPESIAGEKERGTIATLLVTPAKRSHIAIGKILALSFIALLSGASSAIGTIISMPKLMGAASDKVSSSVYSIKDYLLLAVVILSTVLVFVTVISLISAFAKSIKEAQTYSTPIMVIVMLIGITSMFGGEASTNPLHYCIPVYNSVQSMVQIFKFSATPATTIMTVGSNLVVTLIGIVALAKMFQSERIVFSK